MTSSTAPSRPGGAVVVTGGTVVTPAGPRPADVAGSYLRSRS